MSVTRGCWFPPFLVGKTTRPHAPDWPPVNVVKPKLSNPVLRRMSDLFGKKLLSFRRKGIILRVSSVLNM